MTSLFPLMRPHLLFSLAMVIALALAPCSHGLNQPSADLTPTSPQFKYHGGPLLTTRPSINIYLIWYGTFYQTDRTPITDFFASFLNPSNQSPTISTWWKTTSSYKDNTGKPISPTFRLAKQLGDIGYSLGKNIKRAQIANYFRNKINAKILPLDPNGIYLFLTSKHVIVERFCMGSCGFHESSIASTKEKIVYAHVGDPSAQCPGLCAWPYALPAYGPPGQVALVAPNGVGADGMVMNIATVLAGAATNPFKSGYFQGDVLAPLEAVTACPGIFGPGAYPGYPGDLMVDKMNKASYNVYGTNGRKFLLPAMWDPIRSSCRVVV